MAQWMKKAKITVVTGALALVLVGTAFQGIAQTGSAEASFGYDTALTSDVVYHDQDAKRGGKLSRGGDGNGGFGTGGRRWSSD